MRKVLKPQRVQFTTTLKAETVAQLTEMATMFEKDRNQVIEVLVETFYSRSYKKAIKDLNLEDVHDDLNKVLESE